MYRLPTLAWITNSYHLAYCWVSYLSEMGVGVGDIGLQLPLSLLLGELPV